MKTSTTRILMSALLLLGIALFLTPASSFAQVAADSAPAISPETAGAIASPFIVTLALRYPWILTALAAIGAFRFFFKPVISLAEAYVKSTPATNDDELYAKVTHSAAFKWFAWLLDFAFSIKVGPQFTAKPEGK